MDIEGLLKNEFPDMVDWRRHMHRYPELSYHETATSSFVADLLESFGLRVRRNVGGHGIVADLEGAAEGPTVALRADMDALPIQDEKTCEYASTVPGVMHACGHDGHTAALLGAAKILSTLKDQLRGNVRFLFQPAEELSPGGAAPMIEEGALDGVDAVYGVHLWSQFPVGSVYCKAGPAMAAPDEFVIEIIGKGGHGGLPHETVDSLMIGAHLVVNFQSIVSRNMNPVDQTVISVGSFHAGSGFNVIAERTRLNGTVRTFNQQVRERIKERIGKVTADTCSMFDAEFVLDYKFGYPPLVNHEEEAERFFRVANRIFNADQVKELPFIMAGEDFAYYLEKVPGCFMFVGAGNKEKGIQVPHHHPRFDIDETAIGQTAKLLIHMALDFMEENRNGSSI